jgi:hypothetical protein
MLKPEEARALLEILAPIIQRARIVSGLAFKLEQIASSGKEKVDGDTTDSSE